MVQGQAGAGKIPWDETHFLRSVEHEIRRLRVKRDEDGQESSIIIRIAWIEECSGSWMRMGPGDVSPRE